MRFLRMTAVGLDVEQVVDDVCREAVRLKQKKASSAVSRRAGATTCASSSGRKISRFLAH